MIKIYSLKHYHYDWHEFQNLICVSRSIEKLEAHYEKIKSEYSNCTLIKSTEAYRQLAFEESHFLISEEKVV